MAKEAYERLKDGGGEGGVHPGEGVIAQVNPKRIGSTLRRLETVAKFSMAKEASGWG